MSRRPVYLVVLVPPLTHHNAQHVFETLQRLGLQTASEFMPAQLEDIASERPSESSNLPMEPTNGHEGQKRNMQGNGGGR